MIPMGVEEMSLEDVRRWYAAKRPQGPMQEAAFTETLHPRDRRGQWAAVPTGMNPSTPSQKGRRGAMSARDVLKLLRKHGFEQQRQKGSHAVFKNPGKRPIIVPMHGKSLPRGTLMHILASAGISEAALEDWLDSERLEEATYSEVLHPRDRNGRWANVVVGVMEGSKTPHGVAERLSQPQRNALLKVLERADVKDRRLRKLRASLKEWSVVHDYNDVPTDMHSILKMMLARREQHTGLV